MSGEREAPTFGAEPRYEVAQLNQAGRYFEAIDLADELLARLVDAHDVVGVLLSKLGALLDLNRMRDCPAVVDSAWQRLQEPGIKPAQLAEFHAKAADVAFRQGSMERCVTHLVRGTRVLDESGSDKEAMRSWLSTATAYSLVGFHRQALASQRRAQEIALAWSAEDRKVTAYPEIRVRHAVFLDQQGESGEAERVLAEVIGQLGPDDVTVIAQPYLAYAAARHAVLASRSGGLGAGRIDAQALFDAGIESVPEHVELRRLGAAVLAIEEGEPARALELLADAHVTHTRLGRAEIPRLEALAHEALGDYAAAYAAQREVTSMLARAANQLYDLFVDGITVRLDYDELLRNISRFADEARTDPLTGLPNRRHLERHVAELLQRHGRGVIGVCDVDRFKEVNTVHGHLVGDQVLQQVAAILSRTLRGTDFLARFGGDEFVVVLPDTALFEARHIADRLAAAVADYNWETVVPGTPVSLTTGLALLDGRTSLYEAFRAADLQMLDAKRG